MTVKSFSQLRKSSSNFNKLQEKLKSGDKKSYKDDRLWNCQTDKSGNGQAIIRFLPPCAEEEMPFVKLYTHAFKNDAGKWFFANSPTSIGLQCPISDENSKLWNSGLESDKEIVRGAGKDKPGRKRKLSSYSNIYVVKDPANPENEGKVFLFKFGKKIFDAIQRVACPEFEGDEPVNVFDLWEGANFKLRITRISGYANYDSSSFDNSAPLLKDDEEMEAVWKQQYSLNEIVSEDKFEPFDELKTRFEKFIGTPVGENSNKTIEETISENTVVLENQKEKSQPSVDDEDIDNLLESLDEGEEDLDDLASLVE